MIQFIHPSCKTPPIFIYNNFLCTEPHFIPLPPPRVTLWKMCKYWHTHLHPCPVCQARSPWSNPPSPWVKLMENRLLLPGQGAGGRGVQTAARYCGRDRNNNSKRAAVAYCCYNTAPPPLVEGVTQKGLSFMWCGWDAKNNKYGLKNVGCTVILGIETALRNQAKFLWWKTFFFFSNLILWSILKSWGSNSL
jgi:hypothetical protein